MSKGKELFSSDHDENVEIEDGYENQSRYNYNTDKYESDDDKSAISTDKIFGNAFNSGDTEFEAFGTLKLHNEHDSFDSEFTDNSYESYERKELQKEIYDLFIIAPFYDKYNRIKQVSKNETTKVYYYFADPIRRKNRFTMIEIFTEIANFMNLNYKEMFHNLLPLDKQLIIEELDDTFGVLKKRKIKRLF